MQAGVIRRKLRHELASLNMCLSMFATLLVPLDGGAEAASVLPLARTLATQTGAKLVLLRSVDGGDEAALSEASAYLEAVAASLRQAGLAVEITVVVGQPATAIVEAARVHAADLIVMATHGRAGIARAVIGSVTAAVLADCQLPMLVMRPHARSVETIRTLLVPLDGSAASTLALASARELARSTAARLLLVQVAEPLVRYLRGKYIEPEWEEEHRASAQAYLDRLAAAHNRAGYVTSGEALIGPIARTIIESAQSADADIIVMSTLARTGPARTVLGSVADEVVRGADRPVLLIPQSDMTRRP